MSKDRGRKEVKKPKKPKVQFCYTQKKQPIGFLTCPFWLKTPRIVATYPDTLYQLLTVFISKIINPKLPIGYFFWVYNQDMEEQVVLPCAEKMALDTKKQAEAAATVAEHQHGTKLAAYKCQHCSLWHLKSVY